MTHVHHKPNHHLPPHPLEKYMIHSYHLMKNQKHHTSLIIMKPLQCRTLALNVQSYTDFVDLYAEGG